MVAVVYLHECSLPLKHSLFQHSLDLLILFDFLSSWGHAMNRFEGSMTGPRGCVSSLTLTY